tara:strand:- start:723 stop:1589 length:867 start_codon:yes stop_codon:yes gene_type:complete
MNYFNYILITLRPWQWIKNTLVFVPIVFALKIGSIPDAYLVCVCFGVFCLSSSAVYCANDVFDAKADSTDLLNQRRPVASGALGTIPVAGLSLILLVSAVFVSFVFVSQILTWIVIIYYVMNGLYSVWLKSFLQLGVVIVAFGFVLRVYAGAAVIDLELSSWLILVTFFTALFVSLMKRRHKYMTNTDREDDSSTIAYLDASINIVAGSVLVIYCLWVILGQQVLQDQRMLISIPFVACGILRFIMLMRQSDSMRDPTMLLIKDIPLLVTFSLWLIVCLVALYFEKVF